MCSPERFIPVMLPSLMEYSKDFGIKRMCPGLIEGHIHIEFSFLSIREFCNVVTLHATSAVICDPHEINNVLGLGGIDYII